VDCGILIADAMGQTTAAPARAYAFFNDLLYTPQSEGGRALWACFATGLVTATEARDATLARFGTWLSHENASPEPPSESWVTPDIERAVERALFRMGDPSPAPLTVEALFAQPDNAPVLRLFGYARREDVGHFQASADAYPLDEGGVIFFRDYARLLPNGARCSLRYHNVLAHEETARIFALHWGRFTFALRWGVAPGEPDASDRLLRGETLDGTVDLRPLGPGWALWSAASDDAEPEEIFLRLYERAGH
jgi:hypothetical protein